MFYRNTIGIASVLFPLCCFAITPDVITTYPKVPNLFETTSQQSVYRIPALTTCKDGSILAFSDRRSSTQDVRSDQQIDIVCRRSKDGGKTWQQEELVMGLAKSASEKNNLLPVSLNGHAYSDPVVVADRYSNKIIVLCAHAYGIAESQAGTPAILQIVRVESPDGGLTWSQPQNVTSEFYGPAYRGGVTVDGENPKKWKAVFAPSGKLLQLRDGRLAIAMYVHTGSRTCNYVYVSSDLGENWQLLGNCAADGGDEAKLEELEDGTLMISSRVSYAKRKGRLYNYYSWETNSWGATQYRTDVVTVNNNAEVKVLTSKALGHTTNRMLFSFANTDQDRNRQNLCVYYSYEEGATDSWKFGKTLCPGTGDYSTLTVLPDRTIGALTERRVDGSNWDFHIDYDRFSIEELTNGKDWINVTITDSFNPLTDANCNLAGIDGALTIQADAMAELVGKRTSAVAVFDTISVERNFKGGRFYAISFPFDIEHIYVNGNELKEYELYGVKEKELPSSLQKITRKQFTPVALPKANTAYLFRLPEELGDVEVSFVSGPKQKLAVTPGFSQEPSEGKTGFMASSDVLNGQTLTNVYVLNEAGTKFELKENVTVPNFTAFLKSEKENRPSIELRIK